MAEQLKRLSRPDHEKAQRLIGLLTDGSSTVSKVNKGQYLETLTAYQQRVVAQLDAPNPEQAERIEKLAAEIQALREAAEQSVPKARLDEVTQELQRVQKEAEETGARQQEEIERLAEDLKVAESDENPRVVALNEQIAQLGTAHEQATLKQQQVVEQLEAEVRELTLAAKDHSRQINEITRRAEGEAQKAEALQLEMRRYQEAAIEVARIPHGEVAAKLEEAQVEQLRVAVESYQDRAATQFAIDAQFLQRLVSIAPATVPAKEKLAFIWHAVQAIVHMQQTLTPGFGAEATHHLKIQSLLEQIDGWNQQYFRALNGSVDAVRGAVPIDGLMGYLRYELPTILQTIVGYMQMPAANIGDKIAARRAAIAQLEGAFGPSDAVHDHTRNEDAIEANRVEFTIESIYLNTLLAIQGVHQPLRDAHAAEKQT